MLLLMVYWDDDADKKKRLERKLRQKKLEREGLVAPSLPKSEPVTSEDLEKALDIIENQRREREQKDSQIVGLMESLKKTQNLLEEAIKNNQPGNFQIINRPAEKVDYEQKVYDDMPKLEDIDSKIAVIDTSGIEVGKGKPGQSTQTTDDTKGKANKLKELLKKKRGK